MTGGISFLSVSSLTSIIVAPLEMVVKGLVTVKTSSI